MLILIDDKLIGENDEINKHKTKKKKTTKNIWLASKATKH